MHPPSIAGVIFYLFCKFDFLTKLVYNIYIKRWKIKVELYEATCNNR